MGRKKLSLLGRTTCISLLTNLESLFFIKCLDQTRDTSLMFDYSGNKNPIINSVFQTRKKIFNKPMKEFRFHLTLTQEPVCLTSRLNFHH